MSRSEIAKFLILRSIGNFLLLFAIFGVLATFGPVLYYEAQFRLVQLRGINYAVYNPPQVKADNPSYFGQILNKDQTEKMANNGFASVISGPKEQILMPKDTEFSILIPRLGANANVISNVDATNEKEFLPVLQKGVAHAKGTVFPGMKGNIYLFAHSTDNFWDVGRYNAVFYLLKDLKIGDDIIVFFENVRHNYVVTESKVMDPSDVSYLVKSQNTGKEQLILQTCWPPGTTWKRLIIVAEPK